MWNTSSFVTKVAMQYQQVETHRAFTYARRSTYDICCIFAVILFTSIFTSNDRQIWYNSQIIELLILKLITITKNS